MANDLTTNPIKLTDGAATVLLTENFAISKIIWNSGGSGVAGDTVVLKDKLGNIIFDVSVDVAKQTRSEDFFPALVANGLISTTVAHGTVYIYHNGPTPLKTS